MARKRTKRTPKEWQTLACNSACAGATVTEAAQSAGVSRRCLYEHLDSNAEFRRAFDDAIEQGTDVLEGEATRRAVEGVREPVIYQGQATFIGIDKDGNPCDPMSPICVRQEMFTIRKPSDTLAIFLLKGRRPAKFRDNVDVTSNGRSIALAPIKLDGDHEPATARFAHANGNGHNGNGKH